MAGGLSCAVTRFNLASASSSWPTEQCDGRASGLALLAGLIPGGGKGRHRASLLALLAVYVRREGDGSARGRPRAAVLCQIRFEHGIQPRIVARDISDARTLGG